MPVSSGNPAAFHAAFPPASTLTGRRSRISAAAKRATAAVLAGQHQIARGRQFIERLGKTGADRKPRAGDMALAMPPAQAQIDDNCRLVGAQFGG